MEELNNLEQPISLDKTGDSTELNSNQEQSPMHLSENGSIYGKFKDATSLLNAYNSLQKEFTRKSQKLAELTKSNMTTPAYSEANISTDTSNNIDTNQSKEKGETPVYMQENWKNKVETFFQNNQQAKKYAKEIANKIVSDKHLSHNENCLEYAYALIDQQHKVDPANLVNDPEFLSNNIYNNESIKNKIIQEYLFDIKQNKNQYKLISGEPQKISPTPTLNKPKTLKEASIILNKLLR